ncbi:MAG: acetylornithine transaminase [Candidatus Eisenbacteria bacterium]
MRDTITKETLKPKHGEPNGTGLGRSARWTTVGSEADETDPATTRGAAPRSDTASLLARAGDVLLPVYGRPRVLFVGGEGSTLVSSQGVEYLDFTSGIAVNAFGHNSGIVERAVASVSGLIHTSNLYHTIPAIELADALVSRSFADKVFFANSGAEAVEGAIKLARLHAGSRERREILSFEGAFHGRTMGALAATDKERIKTPFRPLPEAFRCLPMGDVAALGEIGPRTAGVLVEPIQGESGVRVAPVEWLQELRQRCSETGTALIFDEIQCGLGRTGTLWAHDASGVEPDLMTLAKPLAAGLPIGAVLATDAISKSATPGCHGSTFGGGPVVCRAGLEVVHRASDPELLAEVRRKGLVLRDALRGTSGVEEVRGRGLMVGARCTAPATAVIEAAFEQHLLLVPAGDEVVRFLPSLIVTDDEIDEATRRFRIALARVARGTKQ